MLYEVITRLQIIQLISDSEFRLSELAKKLNATTSEVHRNLERLEKSGFISKNANGHFEPTTLGQMVLSLIPNLAFVIVITSYSIHYTKLYEKKNPTSGGIQNFKCIC